jgi:hypothetical protein
MAFPLNFGGLQIKEGRKYFGKEGFYGKNGLRNPSDYSSRLPLFANGRTGRGTSQGCGQNFRHHSGVK